MKNLISVFEDTENISKGIEIPITTKHNKIETLSNKLPILKNIKVVNSDTVSTLVEFSKLGKTCVLNMASEKKPGGGVRNGARAQEECLFRCSNLITSVSETFYPLEMNDVLYTRNATFFKDFNYDEMDYVKCDVVTIAAPNLNSSKYKTVNYRKVVINKIESMLSIAIENNVKNILLGAWGCGVFGNNPQIMALMFEEVLYGKRYSSHFDNVIFPIINDHNSVGSNYEIFKEVLNGR